MKWLRPASSFLLMSFSVLIFVSSLQVGVGNFRSPGPGFMGFLSSILLIVLTGITLVKENIRSAVGQEKESSIRWESLKKPCILTVALCGYTFFFGDPGISCFHLLAHVYHAPDQQSKEVVSPFSECVRYCQCNVSCLL